MASILIMAGNHASLATEAVTDGQADWLPPLTRIGPAVIWDGAIEILYDGETPYVLFAGTKARVNLDPDVSTQPQTRFYGFSGEPISFEELIDMDLSEVHVCMRMIDDQSYIVRWIALGPVLTLRGRITDLDAQAETVTVQGFTVAVTENTLMHRVRLHRPCPSISFEDLEIGMPVRIITHHDADTDTYLGVRVLAHTKE